MMIDRRLSSPAARPYDEHDRSADLRPRYTVAELPSASDYSKPPSPEEREWVDAPAAGGELV